MNKKMLVNVVIFLIVGMLITGCDGTNTSNKTLKCTKTNNEGMEQYGDTTISSNIEFDSNGKAKKANLEVVVNIDKIEVTPEKMETLESHFRESICGGEEGYIPGDKCESTIVNNVITFVGKGDFNDIWYNYDGEEDIEEYKKFLESHEEMTCSIEE